MALVAAIGARFFLGKSAISEAGPELLIPYLIAGITFYLVLRALGELTLAHASHRPFAAAAKLTRSVKLYLNHFCRDIYSGVTYVLPSPFLNHHYRGLGEQQ